MAEDIESTNNFWLHTLDSQANECGTPAEGLSRAVVGPPCFVERVYGEMPVILPSTKSLRQESCNEHLPCSGDVDCAFDSWTQWSACTRTDSSLSLDHLYYSFVVLYRISLVQFMSVHDIQLTCT